MTIDLVNAATWGVGDKLTSAQANQLQTNATYAYDIRAGQVATVLSVGSFGGAGRIRGTYVAGANADTTYLVSGANSIIDASTAVLANRIYTLGNTNAAAGDRIMILNRSGFYLTIKNAAAATLIILGAQMQSDAESVWADFLFTGTVWVLFKSSLRPTLGSTEFLASGNYTGPRGITLGLALGFGGGAGGGGAISSYAVVDSWAQGGGGGGGALQHAYFVTLTPGSAHAVVIGAGGPGGAVNTQGTDGGDTTFAEAVLLKKFLGAQGGWSGGSTVSAAIYGFTTGGACVRETTRTIRVEAANTAFPFISMGPASGGTGRTRHAPIETGHGSRNPNQTYAPGVAGAGAADSGSYRGGGGGGGGGAGPEEAGGDGGAGGVANNAGVGTVGTVGSACFANSGGGGGGGGAGGAGSGGGGASAAGGTGGSGKLTIIPIR